MFFLFLLPQGVVDPTLQASRNLEFDRGDFRMALEAKRRGRGLNDWTMALAASPYSVHTLITSGILRTNIPYYSGRDSGRELGANTVPHDGMTAEHTNLRTRSSKGKAPNPKPQDSNKADTLNAVL